MMKKLILTLCCLLCMGLLAANPVASDDSKLDHEKEAPDHPPAAIFDRNAPSRAPENITIQMKTTEQSLIAGENGSLTLKAFLKGPKGGGPKMIWDRTSKAPLTVWISTPVNSGISFLDQKHPDRPRHHLLVKFGCRECGIDKVLTRKINYSVAPRTKTGQHLFWLDILGNLMDKNGVRIEDAGITILPFNVDTHLYTKILMLAVVAIVVFLFIVEWVRVDVVAIAMMVLLPELGLLNSQDTFRGLSSNAVMAIIGVMIISYGLNRAGLVHRMVQPIMGFVGKGTSHLVLTFSALIAAISGVMQNTGAAVLFLPAIRSVTTNRLKIHISRVLMPIGMAAILGGTLTMIGTSPLILLNDILPAGMPKFGFLELTPIGLALAIGGIAYLSTGGMRLLEKASAHSSQYQSSSTKVAEEGPLTSYPSISGPYEIHIPKDFQPDELPLEISVIQKRFLLHIVALKRMDGSNVLAPVSAMSLQPGFALCVYGQEKDIVSFVDAYGLELRDVPLSFKDTMFNHSWVGLVEAVVSPRSSLIDQTVKMLRFGESYGVTLLAVHHDTNTYYQDIAERPLQSGDTLLLHGTWENLQNLQKIYQYLIMITPFEHEYHKPEKARSALICFVGALVLMVVSSFYFQKMPYNPIPLSICLMGGAVGMIVLKVITIGEAYHAVDWRTVFLLSGLIPLGMAVDQTGTARWIATGIVGGLGSLMSPLLLLVVLACLSCAFTLVISNVGACTLLVPLGISLARHIGIDPRVAAIVVGLGVSNSFILPTHQVNALYMGPGEYITKDYIKIGGLLSLVYIAVLVTMVYVFYL
jgi:di/tricarboxylate transporter